MLQNVLALGCLIAHPVAIQEDSPLEATPDTLVASIPKGFAHVRMVEQPNGPAKKQFLPFAFSPDGSRVAFAAAKRDRVYGFLDGDDIGYADKARKPVFTEDGQHVAMALGKVNKNRSESWKVFVDGTNVAKEDWVGDLAISKDGESLAYWTKPNYRVDPSGKAILDTAQLVLARKKKKRYPQTTSKQYPWALTGVAPLLHSSGQRAFGSAYDDLGRGVIIAVGDDVKDEVLASQEGYFSQVVFADDAQRVATVRFLRRDNKRGYEAPDAVTYPRYQLEVDGEDVRVDAEATALPSFSRNGEHYAFVYLRDKAFGIGVDGQLLPASENMILQARPDSSGGRVAWIEHRDGELVENLWLNQNITTRIYQGKSHLCYGWIVEEDGGLALEDVEFSDPFEKIYRFEFSPDEERIAFLALEGASYFVICDGQRMGPFEAVDRMQWIDDYTLGVGTREGSEFWWRTLSLADR